MGQLQPIDIVAPGAYGLNSEKRDTVLSPQWATMALNAVVNRAGRIAARKGWVDQTLSPIVAGTPISVLHEYIKSSGLSTTIATAGTKIYKSISSFTIAANDVTSSTAPTDDNWQFVNFNGKVLGFQRGHAPITWSGTGDFTDCSFTGTGPDGNCALGAFGRLWGVDADLQTIRYSVLLDEEDYTEASGAGVIDMTSVWTNGTDTIVAIASLGAHLIVFGKNHIVLWTSIGGSELGIDPLHMQVIDIIEGTGCIARDSVQVTGEGDMLFLSRHGIQSLGRVIADKNNPTVILSKNVRQELLDDVTVQREEDAEFDLVRSCFSPEYGFYILNLPEAGRMWVVDTKHAFQDEDSAPVFPITQWEVGGDIVALSATSTGDIYFGSAGVVGKYEDSSDDGGAYIFSMRTGWLDFGELNHRLKIMKEIIGTVVVSGSSNVIWVWEFDFSGVEGTRATSYSLNVAEFNIAQFNIDEFSGGVTVQRRALPAYGEGQYIRLGLDARIQGFDVVVQQISIAPKIGRMVA